jgi:sirohydrochlorin ferrochelatase
VPESTTPPRLLLAAHGTESEAGVATTRAFAVAVAQARPELEVSLCYLDVLEPSLTHVLDSIEDEVVVVPVVLSSGYHVLTDIPAVVEGRTNVRVARHIGPESALVPVLAARLADLGEDAATVALAAVPSSQETAVREVAAIAAQLGEYLEREVVVLPLSSEGAERVASFAAPVAIASYVLAEGGLLSHFRARATSFGEVTVAAPIGADPALVEIVLARYAESAGSGVR